MSDFEKRKKELSEYRKSFFKSFKECASFSTLEVMKRLLDEKKLELKNMSRVYKILDKTHIISDDEKPERFKSPVFLLDEFGNKNGEI